MEHNFEAIESCPAITTVCNRESLANAVSKACLAIDRKTSKATAILGNVRLQGKTNCLIVTATDLDMEISVSIQAATSPAFDFTVPAKALADILKRAKACESVTITAPNPNDESGRAGFDFDGLAIDMQYLPSSDLPTMSFDGMATGMTADIADMLHGFSRIGTSMSHEETRYYLNGALMQIKRRNPGDTPHLRMVSTDGHRMAVYDTAMIWDDCKAWGNVLRQHGNHGGGGFIMPRNTITTIAKASKGMNGTAHMEFTREKFRLTVGNMRVTSKLIDGTFPDYHRVIPAYREFTTASFDRAAMVEAVRQVGIVSSEKGRAVKLEFTGAGVQLTMNSPSMSNAQTTVAAVTVADDPEKSMQGKPFGLNSAYVIEAFSMFTGETASISVFDEDGPMLFSDEAEPGLTYVIMPMRV